MACNRKANSIVPIDPGWMAKHGSSSTLVPDSTSPGAHIEEREEEYVPFRRASQILRPRRRFVKDETVQVNPDHGSSFSAMRSSTPQTSSNSVTEPIPSNTNSQDDEYSSNFADDDSATPTATAQEQGPISHSAFLESLGISVLPLQLDDSNIAAFAQQSAQAHTIVRSSSTVIHIHRSSIPATAPIRTLKPDATFRADPHNLVRAHILALNNEWTETRDTTLAAPLQAEWWDNEVQLGRVSKAAHAAHLRRQSQADKAWLLRKLYLRASDCLAVRKHFKDEERIRAALRARLDECYVSRQLVHRRELVEAQLASAALEMNSGEGKWGVFLRDEYLRYLSEDAGRIFLPVRAEMDVSGDGGADRPPQWLRPGYQVIDRGDGEEEAFIVRYFR